MSKQGWESKSEWKVGKAFEEQGVTVVYQYNCGPYTIDLYLPDYLISIEVHGPHHLITERINKDIIRSRFIQSQGIKEFTITAQDANVQGVLRKFVQDVLKSNQKIKIRKVSCKEPFNNQLAIELQKLRL